MNESEDTEEIKTSPCTHTCCKDSRPCPAVSQYQFDALVTQDTRHLCLTQPHPHHSDNNYIIHLSTKATALQQPILGYPKGGCCREVVLYLFLEQKHITKGFNPVLLSPRKSFVSASLSLSTLT